jgi:hypothetical protein
MIFVYVKLPPIAIFMRKLILIMLTCTLFASGCDKNNYDAPGCIEDKINQFKATVVCDNGAFVALYTFKGKNVYLFNEGSCGADLEESVYSEDCYKLGSLGGITGNTMISGVKFYEEAKFVKRIWEN